MADGGYLVPPSQNPSKEKIWIETRKRLERFLPDLFGELFPDKLEQVIPAHLYNPSIAPPGQTRDKTTKESDLGEKSPRIIASAIPALAESEGANSSDVY
jgi:golgi-specific brefeldin A-resistance guanine nucleotide exchange factor 1